MTILIIVMFLSLCLLSAAFTETNKIINTASPNTKQTLHPTIRYRKKREDSLTKYLVENLVESRYKGYLSLQNGLLLLVKDVHALHGLLN